jgi:hypothetical protein
MLCVKHLQFLTQPQSDNYTDHLSLRYTIPRVSSLTWNSNSHGSVVSCHVHPFVIVLLLTVSPFLLRYPWFCSLRPVRPWTSCVSFHACWCFKLALNNLWLKKIICRMHATSWGAVVWPNIFIRVFLSCACKELPFDERTVHLKVLDYGCKKTLTS